MVVVDADLGASSASQWTVCDASPGFIAQHKDELPDDSSRYANEGTEAHLYAGASLIMGFDKGSFPSRDMAKHVEGYVNMVMGWANLPGASLYVESQVPLFYNNQRRGLIDACVVLGDSSHIYIGDLKYGAGVSVWAESNKQLTIYSWSTIQQLWALYEFTDETLVTLVIYQPRIIGEQAVREWTLTLGELRKHAEEIGAKAATIYALHRAGKPTGSFRPDVEEACKFCKAISICTARAAYLLSGTLPAASLELMPEAKEIVAASLFPEPSAIPPEKLAKIVFHAPAMKVWLEKCEAAGAFRLHNTKGFPGFKLVKGRGGNRAWANPKAAETFLRDWLPEDELLTQPSLRSPAQVEEALRSAYGSREDSPEVFDLFKTLVVKPEGKPTMVPDTDPRPVYQLNVTEVFEDLTKTDFQPDPDASIISQKYAREAWENDLLG